MSNATDVEVLAAISKNLSDRNRGMTTGELARQFKLTGTAWMLRQLRRLEAAGLVEQCYPHDMKKFCWATTSQVGV